MSEDHPHVGPPASAGSINGLVLNLFLPGLGSLIAGRVGPGTAQLAMLALGGLLFLVGLLKLSIFVGFVGGSLMLAAWIWALTVGLQLMSQSVDERREL